jgi:hypothetical protein
MSKKKNTLKDLDEFLKQQAATLVTPDKLSDKVESKTIHALAPTEQAESKPNPTSATVVNQSSVQVTRESILNDLQTLARQNNVTFNDQFYDIIIKTVEMRGQFTPEDKMLINTALYLKVGDRWKDVIREYWKKHQP